MGPIADSPFVFCRQLVMKEVAMRKGIKRALHQIRKKWARGPRWVICVQNSGYNIYITGLLTFAWRGE